MRITAFFTLFMTLLPAAKAAEVTPPVFLPESVRGVLLTGPLIRKPFVFHSGLVSQCERAEVLRMVLFRCKASGGQLQMGTEGTAETAPKIDLTGVNVFYKTQKSGEVLREYHFLGTWTENVAGATRTTPVKWVLYRPGDSASEYLGFLELGWGYSVRVVAAAP